VGLSNIGDIKMNNLYEKILVGGTYAPWNKEKSFNEIYSLIKKNTLIDKYRCFELWKLIEESKKLPSGDIIEIGVFRGGSGALIASQVKECGIDATVYLCDTFTGTVKVGGNDPFYKNGEHSAGVEICEELFSSMKLDNIKILKGIYPDETGSRINRTEFRFCHIDVDTYESAKDILEYLWYQMVSGGIVVFDDYGFNRCVGVTKYVEEQMRYLDRTVIYNLNGHAIVIKK